MSSPYLSPFSLSPTAPPSIVVVHLRRCWRVYCLLSLLSLALTLLTLSSPRPQPHSASAGPHSDWLSAPALREGERDVETGQLPRPADALPGRCSDVTSPPSAAAVPAASSTVPSLPSSSSRWPFAASSDVSSTHAAFLGLVSALSGLSAEQVSVHEAVLLGSRAVASLHDWMDLSADQPPSEYALPIGGSGGQSERKEPAVHIVGMEAQSGERGQQTALEAELLLEGYSAWTRHSGWTKERLIGQRQRAAQFMFPAFATVAVEGNGTAADDGADIEYGRLNFMDHVDVLQAIAASSSASSSLALVLETDAVLTPFFRQRLEWVAASVPDNFTAVFLSGCLNLHTGLEQLPVELYQLTSAPCSPLTSGGIIMSCSAPRHRPTPLLLPSIRSRCTSGYLVSASSASRLLSALQSVTRRQTEFVPISHSLNAAFELLSTQTAGRATVYQMEPPASYERSKLLRAVSQPNPPASLVRAVNYSRAIASAHPPSPPPLPSQPQPPVPSTAAHSSSSPVRSTGRCSLTCGWQRSLSAPMLSRVNSKSGADWSSYISPTAFRDMSDWVYWRHREVLAANDPLVAVNDSVALDCLSAGALIYVQTSMLVKFLNEVHPAIRQPYFLLTGSADATTPGDWEHVLDPNADGSPSMLMHWFGQNGNSSHPHFTGIPIGIPLPMADALDLTLHGQNSVVEGDEYDEDRLDGGGSESRRRYRRRIERFQWDNPGDFDETKWLLVNFAPHTNPAERAPLLTTMCGNSSGGGQSVPFAECAAKEQGTHQYYSSMRAIYHRNSRYRFTLSPPGNGVDCHRTWEALYLGVVPVVKAGPLDPLLVDLPVLSLSHWEQLSAGVLSSAWEALSTRYQGAVLPKLHFDYWRRLIVSTAVAEMKARKLAVDASWTDLAAPRRRCWGHSE